MKHTLLLVGFALGLAQSALAWGLGDLANAAQSLSGKSKCKVCESQIRRGDIGFDDGFCPSHKDCKPCADGCGNWAYPDSPTGSPYCSQCQSKRDEKANKSKCKVCEKQIRKGDIGFDEGFCPSHKDYKPCAGGCGNLTYPYPPFGGPYCSQCQSKRDEKERAERNEKRLREMYRSSVDAELVANCNEQLASCDLNSMRMCADETQDECWNTVKKYGNRILSQLNTLKPDSVKKTRPGKGVGILDLLSVVESDGVYRLAVVSEKDFLASWKSAGVIPGNVYFDKQIIRSICEDIKPKFGSRGFRYCRIANEPVAFPVTGFVRSET